MAKDVILGVVDNYNWDKVKYWANSIDASGFQGIRLLLVQNMDGETSKKLGDKKVNLFACQDFNAETKVFSSDKKFNMVDRFLFIHNFLENISDHEEINRIIITDVRDVVFQDSPSKWLDENLGDKRLLVGSENLKYEYEPWSRNNARLAFGDYFLNRLLKKEIYCAGVIAGEYSAIKDLLLNLWLLCINRDPFVPGGGGPDQTAMNVLLSLGLYKDVTLFTNPKDGWVTHAGTSLPAIKAGSGAIGEEYFRNPNIHLPFVRDVDYNVINDEIFTKDGKKVTIVHQWDRVPEWNRLVEKKYGE
jgi:hypothetical protein